VVSIIGYCNYKKQKISTNTAGDSILEMDKPRSDSKLRSSGAGGHVRVTNISHAPRHDSEKTSRRSSITLKGVTDTGHGSEKTDLSTRLLRTIVIRPKPEWFNEEHWRGKLCRFLHSGIVGHTMNVLLVVDIVLLIVGIQMEIYYLESKVEVFEVACEHHAESLEHYGNHELHDKEKDLVAASIAILSVFLFEIFLSMVAEGMVFFKAPLHWLDMVVISVSMYFEVEGDSTAAEALILVRCWRFLRLIHGVFDILEDEGEHEGGHEGEHDEESGKAGESVESKSAKTRLDSPETDEIPSDSI
jgi:hypothetical protein